MESPTLLRVGQLPDRRSPDRDPGLWDQRERQRLAVEGESLKVLRRLKLVAEANSLRDSSVVRNVQVALTLCIDLFDSIDKLQFWCSNLSPSEPAYSLRRFVLFERQRGIIPARIQVAGHIERFLAAIDPREVN